MTAKLTSLICCKSCEREGRGWFSSQQEGLLGGSDSHLQGAGFGGSGSRLQGVGLEGSGSRLQGAGLEGSGSRLQGIGCGCCAPQPELFCGGRHIGRF